MSVRRVQFVLDSGFNIVPIICDKPKGIPSQSIAEPSLATWISVFVCLSVRDMPAYVLKSVLTASLFLRFVIKLGGVVIIFLV